jgi:hypothetical protein
MLVPELVLLIVSCTIDKRLHESLFSPHLLPHHWTIVLDSDSSSEILDTSKLAHGADPHQIFT